MSPAYRYVIALLCAAIALCVGPRGHAVVGAYSSCYTLVGVAASNIVFGHAPSVYVGIQNTSTNDIWFNAWGGAATVAAPSWHLTTNSGFIFNITDAVPPTISVIATGAGSDLTCFYQ